MASNERLGLHQVILIVLVAGCFGSLTEQNAAAQRTASLTATKDFVERVHIVFMNHLDVGYADFINNILNEYFVTYFDQAIRVAADLEAGGYVETFIYTTHPWLISLYLDCPPNFVLTGILLKCPSDKDKAAFVAAVHKGIITWHAGPMNLQVEMADTWLFEAGIDMSIDLDRRFNITRKTRVLSQRDVPGMTHAVIPSLIRKGVAGVSIGVNPSTAPPALPSLFVWKYGNDDGVLAAWHPGGYPNNPGPNPSDPGGLSRHDCVVLDGFSDALCFAFRTDNSGPPVNVSEVLSNYELLRAEFPNAELRASRLDDFFEAAASVKNRLPVVTTEVGDTWIQGVASDPGKCAFYRAASRIVRDCLLTGDCLASDPRILNFTRFLIKLPEHTWGLPTANDDRHWSNADFEPLRKTSQNFIDNANAWIEQNSFLTIALHALADHPVLLNIMKEFLLILPATPDLTNFSPVSVPSEGFQCPKGNIKSLVFGADGSIESLNHNGVDWASKEYSLGNFIYMTYNESDFVNFAKLYDYNGNAGYDKPNVTLNAHPESKTWPVAMTALYSNKGAECDFYARLALQDSRAVTYYGAPLVIWVRYTVRQSGSALPGLDIIVDWVNKTVTRLPESLSFSFKLKPQTGYKWWLVKMNLPVDPNNVVLNGSQYQHSLSDQGVLYFRPQSKIDVDIRSPDVPLACPLTATNPSPWVFPVPLQPIREGVTGVAFNMYNNVWNTNYIYWYPYQDGDENFRARFTINFIETAGEANGHL